MTPPARAEDGAADPSEPVVTPAAPPAPEAAPLGPPAPQRAARPADRAAALREFVTQRARELTAVAFLVAGVVFVLLGWYGAAHTNIITEQIPYLISGGLLGLGLIVVAGFIAYSSTVERELRTLRRELTRGGGLAPYAADPGDVRARANGSLYAVPGGRSAHVAGCPIIEGKDGVRALPPDEAASMTRCKLCGPD